MDHKQLLISENQALPGRGRPVTVPDRHFVRGHPMGPPYPTEMEQAIFALGCFWGAERRFWQLPGVYVTEAGYAGGYTPNPSYEEVCSGLTGHTESVLVVFDPRKISYHRLLKEFWQAHDPCQGMRQGNDIGTQYRSAIYCYSQAQLAAAGQSKKDYQQALSAQGHGEITTEIAAAGPFYFAEAHHQQYLAKNPRGYCGLGGTGVAFPPAIK